MPEPLANRRKDERIDLRLRPDAKQLIARAAMLENQTVSDFVVSVAVKHSRNVIEQSALIQLNAEDTARFVEALANPPEPSTTLRETAEKYRKAVDRGELKIA
jgi:uncharacterized protein (DUF1778 family)